MLLWSTVFRDKLEDEHLTKETGSRASVLSRFDAAARAGMLNGRAVYGMWLIDDVTAHRDVIRCHGAAPLEIKARHEAYLARMTATN